MDLDKVYSSSELEKLLDAKCSDSDSYNFDTISTLDNPIENSLGFITREGKHNLDKFKGVIVHENYSHRNDNLILFKSRNVMKSVAALLSKITPNYTYSVSDEFKNVIIGENVHIGSNCFIYPGVFINHNTTIGDNVIVHPNVTLGSDGFGLYKDKNIWKKIPHVGAVVIEDNVEIGSGSTIDRGLIDNTHLKKNCKIDNLVHIAHNVTIGENTAIAACTGISNCCLGINSFSFSHIFLPMVNALSA